jgi:flagellar basal body rod protein FlgG
MPLQGILASARSLSFYLRMQEVTANNLSNANTDAFKVDRVTARRFEGADFAVPVQRTDHQQGTFRETGRPLDIGLDGAGYLVVQTAAGERLFRGGSLQVDPDGRLVDAHGDPVLGDRGAVVLRGTDVTFHDDGTVEVDGALAGRLRIVTADPGTLGKQGFGRYSFTGAVQPPPEGSVRVRQGAVEEANVDPLLSMVDLVAIQRAYVANLDALRAMDSVLGVVTNEVGKV